MALCLVCTFFMIFRLWRLNSLISSWFRFRPWIDYSKCHSTYVKFNICRSELAARVQSDGRRRLFTEPPPQTIKSYSLVLRNYQVRELYTKEHITFCPRSSDPFYIVSSYMKLFTSCWTYSMNQLVHILTNLSVSNFGSIKFVFI